ncbi:hypothetical protein [Methylophaga nitratireducenticrescens]|uniref:hypothetical protein n=1 Tax=Methylophaga nitratireducenticrescens TaxID=754476 RepID=UPI000B7A9389|nr:hypothetical protein [Methylophaga nitratireducenticrescens]ASF49082.1 Tat pathway signal protein [Methylophaga nitratireducenticrescens]AUZ83863.1 Tat pathway signal protein [Methylophaga nitratireducenticrescens]
MTVKPSKSRREFLHKLTATVGGTATLAFTANTLHAAPQKTIAPPTKPVLAAKGYQHTEHVEAYYQRVDF